MTSSENQTKIETAIKKISDDAYRLTEIVGRTNRQTENLAGSTGETAASVDSIIRISDEIREKLHALVK